MSLLTIVQEASQEIISAHDGGDCVYVNTQCIYPSNGFVQVVVHGIGNTFSVSDNGGAINELESAGMNFTKPDTVLSKLVKAQGLSFQRGIIKSPLVSREALPVAIALVANVSKDVADWLFDNSKIKRNRDFKGMVRKFLEITFDKQAHKDEIVVGVSNKPHKFENVIIISNGRRLIIDPVIADASSVNARVVANLDVKMANIQGLEQRIIYDDEDDWNPADLNLLQVGAPVIAFSKSASVIRRLAGIQ